MHEVKAKGILSPRNGMNIYRGCTHGCIYCDARSTCYRMSHEFEDVEVKINAPELLEQALRRKREKCMIGTGAMSDPYQHLEKNLRLTRRCLELIDEYGFGLAIQTKSDMILRDLDLLERINRKTKCVVQMTMTTYDEELCRVASDTSFEAGRTALTTFLSLPQSDALDVGVRLNTEYILGVLVELVTVATAEAFCECALVAGYDDCVLRMFTKEPARKCLGYCSALAVLWRNAE